MIKKIDGEPLILKFEEIGLSDIPRVGGKNASLGEMITQMAGAGIRVPNGFAVTAAAYRHFLAFNKLEDVIARVLDAHQKKELSLEEASRQAGRAILDSEWPTDLQDELLRAYHELGRIRGVEEPDVAVRSNDLTQLVLGVDRDSDKLTHVFDERNPAVKSMIISLIAAAHAKGRKVGICGQAPSDYPDFAEFLLNAGIDSISLTPDSFVNTCKNLS